MAKALVTIYSRTTTLPLDGRKEPTSYSGTTSTMVDGGTSVSGHLLASRVREEDVAQISLSWNYLSAADWAEIKKLFKGENYVTEVEFFDQTEDKWIKRPMQISDRSAGMHHRNPDTDEIFWTGCSLQLTEV